MMKKNPGKMNYSSGGYGTPAHLVGELFKLETKVDVAHVPYQMIPQAIQDLMGGVNDYMFITTLPVVELVAAGKLKALAVTAPKPLPSFKDVPSVVDQGYPALAVADWVGFLMRQGTPPEIVARIQSDCVAAMAQPGVVLRLADLGVQVVGNTPAQFAALIQSEIPRMAGVLQRAGLRAQ